MHKLLLLFSIFCIFSSESALSCPKSFTLVNNRCIQIFNKSSKHGEAEVTCSSFGGTLVTAKNAIDNRAIALRAANAGLSSIWIGAFCFSTNPSDCYWDDASGAASSYSNFAAGNPKLAGAGGCVYMNSKDGNWFSASCQVIGMPFICEVPATVADSCPHNYNGYCYYPSTDLSSTSLSHDKAQSLCSSKSMKLASIHSKTEHDFIKSIYKSTKVTQIFLGATASQPDVFKWEDGSKWDFDYTDPLVAKGSGNCLVMDVQGVGLWKEVNCADANYFICKRKAGGPTASEELQKIQLKNQKASDVIELDNSLCPTLPIAPGLFTSPLYPKVETPLASCVYALRALGPYKVGVYFTDFSTNWNVVQVFDENNNRLGSFLEDLAPFSVMCPSNICTVQFSVSPYQNVARGFSAKFLPVSL